MNLLATGMVLLLVGAALAVLLGRWARLALCVGMLAVIVAGTMAIVGAGGVLLGHGAPDASLQWQMPMGHVRLSLDALSAWFALAIGVLTIAAAIYSVGYLQHEIGRMSLPAFAALFCIIVVAMLVVVCAADAVLFLIGWELMSLASYLLIGSHDRDPEVRRAAWTYLIATHLGAAIGVFPLFAILSSRAGSTDFHAIAAAGASATAGIGALLFILGAVGFGTKAGFMPMHVWLPVAHPVAPSPVSAIMSGVVIKTGIYGLLRLLSWLPPLPLWCGLALLAVGIIGGVMGILYALAQQQLKRMLAYSSVENIGIIAIGIGIGMLGRKLNHPAVAAMGFAGAVLHVLNHSLFKGLLFLSGGAVLHDSGTGDIERLGGLARKTPLNAGLFLIGAAAICALPPLNGFVSEWLIYNALFRQAQQGTSYVSAAAVVGITALALIGGLALTAFAKVFGVVFLGQARDQQVRVHRTPGLMIIAMTLLAVGCVFVGTLSWAMPSLLGALGRPVAIVLNQTAPSVDLAMPLPGRPAIVIGLLIVLALVLGAVRRLAAPAGQGADPRPGTWGCGYGYPAARMQYTGSSFGASMVEGFKQLLRSQRRMQRPAGYFPAPTQLSTNTPDLAMQRGFEPVFSFIARAFQRCWPLQHGRIQLYLVYIAATLLVVFGVEAIWQPQAPSRDPIVRPVLNAAETNVASAAEAQP